MTIEQFMQKAYEDQSKLGLGIYNTLVVPEAALKKLLNRLEDFEEYATALTRDVDVLIQPERHLLVLKYILDNT
jgi:hypothetical protein